MKSLVPKKYPRARVEKPRLTLGELIARTYNACGEKDALHILRLAMKAQIIKYSRPQVLS